MSADGNDAKRPITAHRRAPLAACSAAILCSALSLGDDVKQTPATSAAATRPAAQSAPAVQSTTVATRPAREIETRIHRLILDLGAAEYRTRAAAQQALGELGEDAMPALIGYIDHADPEIANRVSALIVAPRDPALRAEVGARLLLTAHADHMQRGAYMLFEDAKKTIEYVQQRVEQADGLDRLILEPVALELREWNRMTDLTQRNVTRRREKKPEEADRILKLHMDARSLHAEAAYLLALDALYNHLEEAHAASTQAAAPTPASQPEVTPRP